MFVPISKSDVDYLKKQELKIKLRRDAEKERKKRFFNDKIRQMGMDTEYIAKQIEWKKEQNLQEKNDDKIYLKEIKNHVNTLNDIDRLKNEFNKSLKFETSQYNKNFDKSTCDTYDINNKNKNEKSIRDLNEKMPVSSIQEFIGEDLNKKNRINNQKLEMKQWCNDGIILKNNINNEIKNNENEYIKERNINIEKAINIENIKNKENKLKTINNYNYIKKQINDNILNREINKKNNDIINENELNKMINSDWLNERYSTTLRNDNNKRYIPYNFKGLSNDMKQEILNEQSNQIKNKIKQNNINKNNDIKYYNQQQNYLKKSLLILREKNRYNKLKNYNVFQYQLNQKNNDDIKRNELNKLYSNKITNEYFNYFNATTR